MSDVKGQDGRTAGRYEDAEREMYVHMSVKDKKLRFCNVRHLVYNLKDQEY